MNKGITKFLEQCKLIHGNRYDYSSVNYVNTKTKVKIICSEHGEFEQEPRSHLRGSGCKSCSFLNSRLSNSGFIIKAKLVHGDKYDYSNVNYINSHSNVEIFCPEHGEFKQTPSNHLSGKGCIECAGIKKLTTLSFSNKAKLVHGDKYDYSNVNYVNNNTKVKIMCSEHGEFEQKPANHLLGKGCRLCFVNNLTDSIEEFIKKSKNIYGNRYDYSRVNYINTKTKVKILCSEHGEFEQRPESHLAGHGCVDCSNDNQRKDLTTLINELTAIHEDKYDYSKICYVNTDTKVTIICPKHGEFEMYPKHLLSGTGCFKCNPITSKGEGELISFVSSLKIELDTNNRSILNGKELDIVIPSHNLAIEYNGLYWHSELFVDKNYHLNKTEACEELGYQLIHVFEDEWVDKKEIVKSRLKNLLGVTDNVIYARKCLIKEVSSVDSRNFLDNNHIQGKTNASVRLGLYYNEELVSLMTFNKPRLGIGVKFDGYELSRFCNKLDTSVVGGASKLLKYFIKTYRPMEIRSYADRRWSMGNLYEKLGFELTHINRPNYHYTYGTKRYHRFNFRKQKLKDKGYDTIGKTEHEVCLNMGYFRIYDCGTISYQLLL